MYDAVGSDGGRRDMFSMVTVALETLFHMTEMQAHEDLKEAGKLCEFDESLGNAMFVSHQWVAHHHPDPKMEQLAVLQQALQNLLAGRSHVHLPPTLEMFFGRLKCPSAADFTAKPLFLWYDYFSCPQSTCANATSNRQLAIDCIPSYVARCYFFVILCPFVESAPGQTLNYSTWEARGWCRLEYMARCLAREDGGIITIKSPHHQMLGANLNGVLKAPGTGEFGFEVDREKVGRVVVQMVWKKLHALLDSGDLHSFRFLLNVQRFYFEGFGYESLESLVPGFQCYIDPSNDADGFMVARFLHDNRFRRLSDRDAAGWSPLCYGVLTGRVPLVTALLEARADANDCITKKKRSANLSRKLPVLSLAIVYHSNEVAQVLLARRANVNARCANSATALTWAAVGGNAPAVRILLEAKTNPLLRCFPDSPPFKTACITGSTAVMREMLQLRVQGSLRFGLHMALALGMNQEGDTVSCLIEAAADVNEQLHIPMAKTVWWGLLKVLHAAHYVSPSALTTLAYHHSGATPLIFATLAGKFECIPILLAAGASLDIPNSHGKTARDFLREMHVPFSWVQTCGVPNSLPDDGSDSDDTISI